MKDRDEAVHRHALAGAGGGLALALADFTTSAGYLHEPLDQVKLGLRLLALLPSLGALGAVAAHALDRAAARSIGRPLLRDAAVPLVAGPALIWLGLQTFSGPRASALPGAAALPFVIAALGVVGLTAARAGLRRLAPRVRAARGLVRGLVAAPLFAAAIAASQANRLLYPRHYEPLHAALAIGAFLLAALGSAALFGRWTPRARPWRWALAAALGVVFTLLSLPADHDGRAALLSPRASTARPVLRAATPALRLWPRAGPTPAEIASARARRTRAPADASLPTWPRGHVVLVTIDALRADHLGAYGYERGISPNLDALARESVVFERAWTTTPRSAWSLVSMFTGVALRPRQAQGQPLEFATLAARLREVGLHAAGFYPDGIFVHDGAPLDSYRRAELSFERRDAEYHDADALTDVALAELQDLEERGEPPSLLWVHYFDVHEPYRERSLGDAPVDRYDGEIRNVDRALGRLLGGLERLSRPVLLIVSADHGEEHLDHGGRFHGDSLYEEQLWVPLIVRAPDLAPRRVATPVSLLDLAPTIYGALDLEPPDALEGVDLRPWLVGRDPRHDPLRAADVGMRAVLRWPHKLIEDDDGGLELFDLASDPAERRSLASRRPDLVAELRAELAAFR